MWFILLTTLTYGNLHYIIGDYDYSISDESHQHQLKEVAEDIRNIGTTLIIKCSNVVISDILNFKMKKCKNSRTIYTVKYVGH
jgi:hypothetical protein